MVTARIADPTFLQDGSKSGSRYLMTAFPSCSKVMVNFFLLELALVFFAIIAPHELQLVRSGAPLRYPLAYAPHSQLQIFEVGNICHLQ